MQDEHGNIIAKNVEGDEQLIAKYCIEKGARVLELGARYGSVTYQIAQHAKHVVAVEPDSTVWGALDTNIQSCKNVTILKGFLSSKPLQLMDHENKYARWGKEDSNSSSKLFTLDDAETAVGGKFDTLVADCEGCLPSFLNENFRIFETVNTIIYEADRYSDVDYEQVVDILKNLGFTPSLRGFQNVWTRNRSLSILSRIALQFSSSRKVFTILIIVLTVLLGLAIGYYFFKGKQAL